MKKLIIHPTDFSKCANAAFDYALLLAKATDSELLLVHALDTKQYDINSQSGRGLLEKSQEVEQYAESKLNELGDRAMNAQVKASGQIYSGYLSSWLPDLIRKEKPMFVVMGTTGAGSLGNKVFGSNADAIIHESVSPVLTVPLDAPCCTPTNISFAADLSKIDSEVIGFINSITTALKSSLKFLYAVSENEKASGEEAIKKTKSVLTELDSTFSSAFELVVGNDYTNAIGNKVINDKPDLLVIVRSNKNFFEKLLFGSLSERMIYYSNIPLLVLPNEIN